jgi:hypothetical protein
MKLQRMGHPMLRLGCQIDGAAGLSGAAGGVEDADDGDVGVEGG